MARNSIELRAMVFEELDLLRKEGDTRRAFAFARLANVFLISQRIDFEMMKFLASMKDDAEKLVELVGKTSSTMKLV